MDGASSGQVDRLTGSRCHRPMVCVGGSPRHDRAMMMVLVGVVDVSLVCQ